MIDDFGKVLLPSTKILDQLTSIPQSLSKLIPNSYFFLPSGPLIFHFCDSLLGMYYLKQDKKY